MDHEIENPFSNNPDVPKTTYKFRSWRNPKHRKILDGELYFSSPFDFNDPFDCNILIPYDKLQNNSELRVKYFTMAVERHKPHLSPEQKEVEVNSLIAEGRYKDTEWIKYAAQLTRKSFGNDYGVFCLSETKDSILLWSHYADCHRGFCIGYNSEELFNECFQQYGIGGGRIHYSKDYPDIDLLEDLVKQTLIQIYTKSISWNYEEEYRLTKIYAARTAYRISKKCFKEINLGCDIEKSHREEIIDYVKNNIEGLPVYLAKTVKNKFELSFEQIA
jgi:hypothetical protein